MSRCHILISLAALLLAACSSTKYVPEGEYLLDEVRIHSDNRDVKPSALALYVRQNPNSKWFSLLKTQLYIYNWSGRDSTRWLNRALRRLGDAPVIYSEEETERTAHELAKAVRNMGYMRATVNPVKHVKKKKLKLDYRISPGMPYTVRSLRFDIQDSGIAEQMREDSLNSLLRAGMTFDVNLLEAERQRITNRLRQRGYYKFNKEYVTFTADTVRNTFQVDLTLHLQKYRPRTGTLTENHRQYTINRVGFVTEYDMLQSSARGGIEINDSLHYRGYPIYYKDHLYLRPKVLVAATRIVPGSLYDEQEVQRTYSNFGRLQALKYTNVRFFEHMAAADSARLDAYILLTRGKQQSVSFEVEGTNSAGDLGAAASVTFQHRNLFRGSEAFTLKLRGAYEAVSGLQSGLDQDYTELGAEATVNFPRFMFPFLSRRFKSRVRATSELGVQYNYQMRPEFTRIIASASWSYKWGLHSSRSQHRVDLLDINYLYMPGIDPYFKEKYLERDENYILKYNYEDRFIVRTRYSFVYHSAPGALSAGTLTGNAFAVRLSLESAGNLLYAGAKMFGARRNAAGEYTLLDIPFAHYLKGDFDYARSLTIDRRNSLAFHFAFGIAYPYGNASMLPFEKRYFAGGANSVRGWSVRELGPGSFAGDGNFMNQSGDLKLDASVELRTRLFWKLRGALFVDAGNIWTLRNYKDQPGGQFRWGEFYKQIAVAYGAGLRLDLDFFILRFDGGMKALNPAYSRGRDRYPLVHPRLGRDFAFHFAVGYPF